MSKRHDLVIYVPSLSGGGAERAMLDLAHALRQRGRNVVLVCNAAGDGYRTLWQDRGLAVHELNTERTLSAAPRLARALHRLAPHTVLSTITHANILAIVLGRASLSQPRIVVRQANTMPKAASVHWRARASVLAVPWVYRAAHSIVAVSRATRVDLENHGVPQAKIEVIPNGVDHDFVATRASEPMTLQPPTSHQAGPVIVSVGRLTQQKAFDVLLRAFSQIRQHKDFAQAKLWILGEGSDRKKLATLARELNVHDEVWMPGFVSNPFPYLVRAQCFVLCSRWEGMPNALIQALSLGIPSVATDAPGGSREVLQDGAVGQLVAVDDHAALAIAITRALDSPSHSRITQAWRDDFALQTTVDRYEDVLFAPNG